MGRVVLVTSIPHAGTRFVFEHLLSPLRRSSETEVDPEGFLLEHISPDKVPRIRAWLRLYPCIVPIKHPRDVAISWKKRNLNNRTYYQTQNLCDYYRRLVSAVDPFEPFYLPLDRPDRQEYLDSINRGTWLNLETDWPIWQSIGGHARLNEEEEEMVVDLLDELSGFFTRFWYI